jgi:ABC-2 type transport system permease protein
MLMNLGFYILIFNFTKEIGDGTGWGKYQFFVFLSTTLLVNSVVQGVFMNNFNEFSELIRTGNLDFALLKPIDTQFLISLGRINWTFLANFSAGVLLLAFSLWKLAIVPGLWQLLLYPLYVVCGIAILYSLMIVLASLSVWLGRNQSLYDFWFYITNFSRYPMEIYHGTFGDALRLGFTFVVPILIVVNVPARIMAWPLEDQQWGLSAVAILAALASLAVSRRVFIAALGSYRSASS